MDVAIWMRKQECDLRAHIEDSFEHGEFKAVRGENIKTDSDLVRVARQMEGHFMAIRNILYDLEDAEHPGAKDFICGLDNNALTAFAWPEHIVYHSLLHPERWETDSKGIHYIGKESK